MNMHKETDGIHNNLSTITRNEQTSSDESQPKQSSTKRRQRASVACASCRDRRIRCVVPSGNATCIQCERTDVPCVIKDDDERRKPISRAYVYSLVERVALLERLLEDQGLPIPPSNHPPEIRHYTRRNRDISSSDDMSKSPYASQASLSPSIHDASSPFSSVLEPESKDHDLKKQLSDIPRNNNDNGRARKRRRNDSLISKTKIKVETILNNDAESPLLSSGPNTIAQPVNIQLATRAHFWPTSLIHTHDQDTYYPEVRNVSNEYQWYNALGNGTFVPPFCFGDLEYEHHSNPVTLQCPGNTTVCPEGGTINLDFLPFSSSSSS